MKIYRANPKGKIVFLLFMCTVYIALGQDVPNDHSDCIIEDRAYSVQLDADIKVNANHKYIDFFSLQNEDYIQGLYKTNQINMKEHTELMNPAKLVKHSGGNNSLIFTVHRNGVTYLDTLRNSLHPHEIESGSDFLGIRKWFAKLVAKNHISVESIEGSLPKGGMTWISAKRQKVEFGILVPEVSADVTIILQDENNEVIAIIIDDVLRKGWNNYKWERGTFPKGKYKITFTMNGQTMSQMFKC